MSWPFTRPTGDPASVRSGARAIGTATGRVGDAQTQFGNGAMTALTGWESPVATDFAELSGSASMRIAAAGTQLEGTSSVLLTYAELLESAQDAYDALHGEWQQEQRTIDRVDALEEPTPDDDAQRSAARSRQGTIESDVREALSDLDAAEVRTANALDESTDALVPGGSGMTPEQLFSQVTRAWGAVAPGIGSFFTSTSPLLALDGLRRSIGDSRAARAALDAYAASDAAALLASQVENLELAKVDAAVRTVGDVTDMRVLRQYFEAQAAVADAADDARKAFEGASSARSSFLNGVAATTRLTRGLAVLGIFGAGYDLFANPDGHTGVRRGVDVVMDVASIGAGAYVLATGAGFLAVTPVGAAVVVGVAVVAGAWAIGNFVVDNWDSISHGLEVAGDWVVDQGEMVFDGAVAGVEWTGERIADGGRWVGDRVEDLGDGFAEASGDFADAVVFWR